MNKYIQHDLDVLGKLGLDLVARKHSLVGWVIESRQGDIRIEHTMPNVVWLLTRSNLYNWQYDAIKFESIEGVYGWLENLPIVKEHMLRKEFRYDDQIQLDLS